MKRYENQKILMQDLSSWGLTTQIVKKEIILTYCSKVFIVNFRCLSPKARWKIQTKVAKMIRHYNPSHDFGFDIV